MDRNSVLWRNIVFINLLVLVLLLAIVNVGANTIKRSVLESKKLCSQCSTCTDNTKTCPPSESYPHMTVFDDTLIAGALQSDFVNAIDRGVYSVPDIVDGESAEYNAYFGWELTRVWICFWLSQVP